MNIAVTGNGDTFRVVKFCFNTCNLLPGGCNEDDNVLLIYKHMICTNTVEKCNSSLENFNTGLMKLAVISTDMMCSF